MIKNKYLGTFLVFLLTISFITFSLPQTSKAQTSIKTPATVNELQSRLSKIEAKIEKRRKKLGIPGVSLAIVKDGKVIYSKGLGYKNFEKKISVTANTQFAIGSATKAFTGLSVLMSQDEGKLSLDDKPRKYLSYFKINDPKINENIQVRDLLSHSSGLNRTDLGWISGKLNREEIVKLAGIAKPIAGLRKKFLYQNVMFLTAGMIVEKVQNQPWENFISQRIFAPLNMNNTNTSVKQMQKAKDYSFGYIYNSDTKITQKLPFRNIGAIGPAGAINSSANDMAKWLKFILNKGEINGKRLVSEKGFKEWTTPHMKITKNGSVSYGFGWFIQKWKDKKVIQHGGNIDGFNSMVALMPEENLGFVLLTNVSASPLGNELMQVVFSEILDKTNATPLSAQAKKEVGIYSFSQAGFDLEVRIEDRKLVAKVPGQPTYILEKVKGRKYRLSNAPAGFFITFKDAEAFLEQPQGNYTLPKKGKKDKTDTKADNSAKELLGTYESTARKGTTIKIKNIDGKPSLVVGQQPPYPLKKRDDGNFGSPKMPATYYLKVKRDSKNKISGVTMVQPQGEFEFKYIGETEKNVKTKVSVEDLLAKTVTALGGEENMRKISSRIIDFKVDFIHQGVKGYGKLYQKAPNKMSSRVTLTAFSKKIGWIKSVFDGNRGGESFSFRRGEAFTGKRLANVKVASDFYAYLDWKNKIKKAEVVRTVNVGKEKAYLIRVTPKNADNYGLFISTKTFLPIQKISLQVSSTSPQRVRVKELFSDYRKVDGVMIPYKTIISNPGTGDLITYVLKVKHNAKISEKKFRN